jgi:hypothetical protein
MRGRKALCAIAQEIRKPRKEGKGQPGWLVSADSRIDLVGCHTRSIDSLL